MAKKPAAKKAAPTKKPKVVRITQSMMKSLYELRQKEECGLLFEAKFLDGRWGDFAPSDAMRLGTWFEWRLTGALPKNGEVPEPDYTKKGEFTAPYRVMEQQVENFKKIMAFYHIELVSFGDLIKHKDMEGTIDLMCRAKRDIIVDGEVVVKKGQLFIVDIKSSGLLDDKFHDFGWELNNLGNKVKLILQPIHYKYISRLNGEEMPFLFFLFNTKDANDCRIINFVMDDQAVAEHEAFIAQSRKWVAHYVKKGFPAHPTVARCGSCPLKVGCKHFAAVPPIQNFYYGGTT